MRIRILAAAAAFGLAAMPVLAGEPAVSVLNFKVTAQAGDVEDEGAWLGLAQVTAPLGHAWGLQGEAGVFDFDGDTAWGLAGHAFTRDPAQYLVGAFGAYASSDAFDIDVGRIGIEGEYYLERITLAANTGYQFGDSFIDDTWFGEVAATWYADDDFGITGGAAFDDEIVIGHFGLEWLVGRGSSLPGLALRGDIYMGDNEYDAVMGGITYYFGQDATLKDRHRKQDPDSALLDLLNSVEASCGQPPEQVVIACAVSEVSAQGCLPPPTTTCGQSIPR
jgi:hypothetical protein